MKKYVYLLALVIGIAVFTGCRKSEDAKPVVETFTKFPSPDWKVDNTGKYPFSMTAVVQVPDSLKATLQTSDKIGAFIKDECRGVGVLVNSNNTTMYFVLIKGTASEMEKVSFKYYSANSQYMFTTPAFLNFEVDANYGAPDKPEVLTLKAIR